MATYQFEIQQKAGSMRISYEEHPAIYIEADSFTEAKKIVEELYVIQDDESIVLVTDEYIAPPPEDSPLPTDTPPAEPRDGGEA